MSRTSIEHRVARVSMATGLSTALSIVFQLISVPVCLTYWGRENYGSWLALFSAFMLLRSLDSGYVVYVGNKLNCLYHQDAIALREHLSSAVIGIAIIGGLQLLLAVGALVFYPLASIMGMPSNETSGILDKIGLIVLIGSWVFTGSYLGIVHRLQIPVGMMYQAVWWAMAFQVSQFIAIIIAALFRLDLLYTCILFSLSQMANYVASAIYIRYKIPEFYPWWKGWNVRVGLNDLRHSLMLAASNLIQQSSANGIVIMVSIFAGPVAVPIFTTVRTLANLWNNVTNVLTTPLLPDVVRFHAKNEVPKLLSMTQAHWVIAGSIVNLGVLMTYPLLPLLYGYWTGHVLILNKSLLGLFLGSVVVANVGSLIAMHLNGINSHRIVLIASLVRSVMSLGGGALFYGRLGLVGFSLGILAGEVLASITTICFFLKNELVSKGSTIPLSSLALVTLSVGSVLLFLLGDGFGWFTFSWSYLLACSCVIASTIWGWKRLDRNIRLRLVSLLSSKIKRFYVPTKLHLCWMDDNALKSEVSFNRKSVSLSSYFNQERMSSSFDYHVNTQKKLKLGILVSHPIQYFIPVYQDLAKTDGIDLMVMFRTRVGLDEYYDCGFGQHVKWDIPLVDGYKHQFLSEKSKIEGVEWNIVAMILSNRFDVLMVHGYNNLTNILAIFAARIIGTKVLMRGDTRIQARHNKSKVKIFFKKMLFKLCNGFVSIGTLNQEYYVKHGVQSERLFFAPFCVCNRHFNVLPDSRSLYRSAIREELGLASDSLIILFASKLIKRKRADEIIRSVAKLSVDFPTVCLVIAGSGEEEYNLRLLAETLDVWQIRFVGFQNQAKLPALYAASDIFVLPADSEPWGLVVNEVMAAGLPVIVSSEVGAAPDLVEGKSTGIVYPCGDVLALTQAVRSLLAQPALRKQFSKNTVKVIQKWDVNECVKGIINAAKSLSI